jgi:hypothetical protein
MKLRFGIVFALLAVLVVGANVGGVDRAEAQFSAGPQYGYTSGLNAPIVAAAAMVSRCYQHSYSGSHIDLVDAATGNTTGTRLQCANGVISALVSGSACTFVTGNACSSLTTTCGTAGSPISCEIVTFYDETGAAKCGGACNWTAAHGSRALYTYNAVGSQACATFNGTSSNYTMTGFTGQASRSPSRITSPRAGLQ